MNENASLIGSLYEEYYRDVYQFALYFTNNKQEAEDITQETFIKAMKNIHQLKDQNKKKTWILSIARNTAVDLKRKQKMISFLPKIFYESMSKDEKSHDSVLISKEKWTELQQALLQLKPHYRSVVILRVLKDLSVKETAQVLGCNEIKVRVDLHRALIQLKRILNLQEGWKYLEETK
ncbi:RNA polymerase sigma factor [Bacillus sp. FJAT-27445]|uniref:RNA polymerase sigma factor n=1 Tax=Bacillus sp. FJAT-27445 TaxID=1679166 RepID=UPI0007437A2E|nr:RNA polymerase sigma factor [Bacillus sp. FJAT-27445]